MIHSLKPNAPGLAQTLCAFALPVLAAVVGWSGLHASAAGVDAKATAAALCAGWTGNAAICRRLQGSAG